MDFAVWHEGVNEGQGRWVFVVQDYRFLLADDEGEFYWRDMADCKLVRVAGPDQPRPVIPFQPQLNANGPGVVLPNRAERRALERNGY